MTSLQCLSFNLLSLYLRVSWLFYNERQKEATLQSLEQEIFNTLLDNENGQYSELAQEMQELYVFLLNK